jgi:hypothetical protein
MMSKLSLVVTLCLAFITPELSGQEPLPTRRQIYEALRAGQVLNPDRLLVHYSHTCSLNLGGVFYPVVDVEELVKGSAAPRGVNRIVVFSPTLGVVKEIGYTRQRPLFCEQNKLYVYGDLALNNIMPEGNVLSFEDGAKTVKISRVDANDYPIPTTRSRKLPPQ